MSTGEIKTMCKGKYKIYTCRDREDWLQKRLDGIGASEASAAIGCNPYMDNLTLWKIKTGLITREEISNNKNVVYGTEAEEPLRKLFELDYPQYDVSYSPYKILQSNRYPFMTATLVQVR